MKRLDNAVFTVTEAKTKGEFPGGSLYIGTLANGGVGLAPFHDFEGEIPAELSGRSRGDRRGHHGWRSFDRLAAVGIAEQLRSLRDQALVRLLVQGVFRNRSENGARTVGAPVVPAPFAEEQRIGRIFGSQA